MADGRTVNYQSDAAGRLVKYTSRWEDNASGTGGARCAAGRTRRGAGRRSGTTTYGRLVTLTNENGESYRFRHDVLDRLAEQINPDGCRQTYRYKR